MLDRLLGRLRRIRRQRQQGRSVRIRLLPPDGPQVNWVIDDTFPREMEHGTYEIDTANCIRRLLQPGDHFVDVGANCGYFTLLAASLVGPTGRVQAFEPAPHNVTALERLAAGNPDLPIEIVPEAVSDSEGEQVFLITRNSANGRLSGVDWELAKQPVEQIPVRTTTLRPLFEDQPPQLIKIDVEGAEDMVLAGLEGLPLGDFRTVLLVEFHGREKAERCVPLLRSWGFELCDLDGQRLESPADAPAVLALPPSGTR